MGDRCDMGHMSDRGDTGGKGDIVDIVTGIP